MRIFKLARRSIGLQVIYPDFSQKFWTKYVETLGNTICIQAIAHTMKCSYKELGLLLMFVGMGMLIFGRSI